MFLCIFILFRKISTTLSSSSNHFLEFCTWSEKSRMSYWGAIPLKSHLVTFVLFCYIFVKFGMWSSYEKFGIHILLNLPHSSTIGFRIFLKESFEQTAVLSRPNVTMAWQIAMLEMEGVASRYVDMLQMNWISFHGQLTGGVPLVRRLSVGLTHCHKNWLVMKCCTDLRLGWILWIDPTVENGLVNVNSLHWHQLQETLQNIS